MGPPPTRKSPKVPKRHLAGGRINILFSTKVWSFAEWAKLLRPSLVFLIKEFHWWEAVPSESFHYSCKWHLKVSWTQCCLNMKRCFKFRKSSSSKYQYMYSRHSARKKAASSPYALKLFGFQEKPTDIWSWSLALCRKAYIWWPDVHFAAITGNAATPCLRIYINHEKTLLIARLSQRKCGVTDLPCFSKVKRQTVRWLSLQHAGAPFNPLTSYVPNSSHPTLCSFILHTVIFIAQRPVSQNRPESHFRFMRFIAFQWWQVWQPPSWILYTVGS